MVLIKSLFKAQFHSISQKAKSKEKHKSKFVQYNSSFPDLSCDLLDWESLGLTIKQRMKYFKLAAPGPATAVTWYLSWCFNINNLIM